MRSATLENMQGAPESTVSIHALLTECDFIDQYGVLDFKEFQSTHSLWSATHRSQDGGGGEKIVSIHALLVECDSFRFVGLTADS